MTAFRGTLYPQGLLAFFHPLGSRTAWAASNGDPIYVVVVASTSYDPYGSNFETDRFLTDVVGVNSPTSAIEPPAAVGYFREPLILADPVMAVDTDFEGDTRHCVELKASADINYTVPLNHTFSGYHAVFYVDKNVGNAWGVPVGTHYAPTGTASGNNRNDSSSPIIGVMPFTDRYGVHSWAGPYLLTLPMITPPIFSYYNRY